MLWDVAVRVPRGMSEAAEASGSGLRLDEEDIRYFGMIVLDLKSQ